MKKALILIFVLAFKISIQAQEVKPEPIYSFAKVLKSADWYKQQANAWKSEISKNPKNAYAWYNYYRVKRNLKGSDESDTRMPKEKWAELNDIIADMEKNVPNSFEYNLCKWMTGGNDFKFLPYLEKAYKLGPDRPEIFSEMINWGEVTGDEQKKNEYAQKWYSAGQTSPGFLYYNYNVLAGLKPNAILLTSGDNDTYPVWVLQAVQAVRKDVTVLNTSLLYIKEYRMRQFKKLGIKDIDYDISKTTDEARKKQDKDLLNAIVLNDQKYPVYIALTVCKDNYEFADSNLYLTGLAYEYSAHSFDNIAVLKRNFEQVYALDYLDKYFFNDISEGIVKRFGCNYIVPAIKLYEHYKLSDESQKAAKIKALLVRVTAGTDQEKEVNDYFKQN